jgi:hypothetical protein
MLKMIIFAEQRHLNHNNINELMELIASEIKRQGLDPTNVDSYFSSVV